MSHPSHSQLFSGAAQFYRHRAPYPAALIARMRQHFGLDGTGRLLDVGCGPGNLALALQADFSEVLAVDINAEMLELAQQQAQGLSHLHFKLQSAETIGPELGRFKLVTFGRSFHWMQRAALLQKLWEVLEPGGGLAIIDGGGSNRDRDWWNYVVQGLIVRWRLHQRPVEPKTDAPHVRHETLVAEAGFAQLCQGEIGEPQTLGLDQLVGQVYSMSSSKPELFGKNLERFDQELRAVLTLLQPSGLFERQRSFSYIFAHKP